MLPSLHEGREDRKLYRLDLFPERRQRASTTDLDDPSRAPLDVLHLAPEFTADQLPGALPLGKSRLDPLALPTVATVHFQRGHRPGLRQESRQDFAPRNGRIDRGMSQNVGYEAGRVLLIQGHRPTHVAQLLLAESGHVAWKGLGENEAPFSRFRDTELNRNHSPRLQQFREWIRATPLFLGCNARLKFFRGQVARAVQQMRELVIGACPTPRRSSSSFSEGLLDCFAGDVVAPLTAHLFVVERSSSGMAPSLSCTPRTSSEIACERF